MKIFAYANFVIPSEWKEKSISPVDNDVVRGGVKDNIPLYEHERQELQFA